MTKGTHRCSYVLFTNISHVGIESVFTYTNALVLSMEEFTPGPSPDLPVRVMGFGVDQYWQTFTMWIPSSKFTLTNSEGAALLRCEGAPPISMMLHNKTRPLDVQQFEGENSPAQPRQPLDFLWDILPAKVMSYWTGPEMPVVTWKPINKLRRR